MNYNQFLEEVRAAVQERLGNDYEIRIQKITKNNGIVLDGLIIGEAGKGIAPTIYLNPYYTRFKHGMSLADILPEVISEYKESSDIVFGDMKRLLDFNNLKDRVVYKLVQRETNQELLGEIPAFEFLDLAVVFYLILDENKGGQMTALIRSSHMTTWGTTKEELYRLAKKNTPELLPPVIKTIKEIMRDMLKEHLGDFYMDEILDDLLEEDSERKPFYVLSNEKQINGAGCLLYEDCLKKFAEEQNADVIILPSSVHEVILLPDKGDMDYAELQEMVSQINRNEVPEEDVLSNGVYKYSRRDCGISLIE